MKYWINTVSKEHVELGIAGAFTQAGHGKNTRLKRLSSGDGLLFYSPRAAIDSRELVQAFTAIGTIEGDDVYQVELQPNLRPWRRAVRFAAHTQVSIRPLIEDLSFIQDKKRWGFPFRRGLFEIPQDDFMLIAQNMNVIEQLQIVNKVN